VVEDTTAVEHLELIHDSWNRLFKNRFRSVRIKGPIRVVVVEHSQFHGTILPS